MTAKSGLIHFKPVTSPQEPKLPTEVAKQPAHTINGTAIEPSPLINHLGIHFDDSLSFCSHADVAASEGLKNLARLTALRHQHRGLSTYTARHLIKTALLPKMLWASPVWWAGSQPVLSRLEPVYHQALRWATGLPKYVSNRKLFLLSRSPPLQCMLDQLPPRRPWTPPTLATHPTTRSQGRATVARLGPTTKISV